mmetsp:Transcript_52008/g.82583  ORF Transcript_52008/g.82583 Transcript_52008/m.82583 type:complete len:102 (-) Transcript_52008:244-549(-)
MIATQFKSTDLFGEKPLVALNAGDSGEVPVRLRGGLLALAEAVLVLLELRGDRHLLEMIRLGRAADSSTDPERTPLLEFPRRCSRHDHCQLQKKTLNSSRA